MVFDRGKVLVVQQMSREKQQLGLKKICVLNKHEYKQEDIDC